MPQLYPTNCRIHPSGDPSSGRPNSAACPTHSIPPLHLSCKHVWGGCGDGRVWYACTYVCVGVWVCSGFFTHKCAAVLDSACLCLSCYEAVLRDWLGGRLGGLTD